MAEPAWKTPRGKSEEPDLGILENEEPDLELLGEDVILLERWVERPDGRMELLHKPLTREDYLNPLFGDKWLQGQAHGDLLVELTELLKRCFHSQQEVLVLMDVQHQFGPGFPKPSPDISVIRGVRDRGGDRSSFDVRKEGVVPSLILEVISRRSGEIRETDEEDKVRLYARAGIPEYLMVYPPGVTADHRFQLAGLRLGPDRCYHPIEPDAQGRLLSETTGLLFGVSAVGDRIEVFDVRTGERLLRPLEESMARRAAEAKAAREAEARKAAEEKAARAEETRKAAEEKLAQLRAEIERLKRSSG
jgi:Uma2 family endonuclease